MLKYLLALIAGSMLTLAFAPFKVYSIAFFSPAILLYCWLTSTNKQSYWQALFFGCGFFATGTSWVYISIHNFGNANIFLASLITIGFTLILASLFVLQAFLFKKIFGKKPQWVQCLLIFPALWLMNELFRNWLFTGFPWLLLGYSQVESPLNGLAPIFGVFGLSLLIAMMSGSLVMLATKQHSLTKIFSGIIIAIIVSSGWFFSNHQWTDQASKPVQVSLIQGNIATRMKWNKQDLIKILKTYQDLTSKHWSSKIIVWPEAAIPEFPQDIPFYFKAIGDAAKKNHSNIILGVPIYHQATKQYFNGLKLIGSHEGVYLKKHLVPFGEYTPLQIIFGSLMQYFNIPMSGFTPGPNQQTPLKINHFVIAPFICYEIAFPFQVVNTARHSQLMVNLVDDGWFGRSLALAQHLQMAQMAALTTGRYLLEATNTGITAIIDPLGKIIKISPPSQQTVLTGKIYFMQNNTPLLRFHYWPVIVMMILLIVIGFSIKKR